MNNFEQFLPIFCNFLCLYWYISVYLDLYWLSKAILAISAQLSWTISGYLYSYLWLSRGIQDYIWLSRAFASYRELYFAISGYFWLSLAISGYYWLSLAISIKHQVSGYNQKQERASYCYLKLFGSFMYFFLLQRFLEELAGPFYQVDFFYCLI